jgi:antirestriction protein ArdC
MNADARTSIDNLLATLKAALAQPGRSMIPLLGVMSRFPKYSLSNQLLIFAQRPDATRVQGYRAWLKAGYQVRKGEKGIAIYAPMFLKRDLSKPPFDDSDPEASTTLQLGYRVAYVFDITQVDRIAGTNVTAVTATPVVTGSTAANRFLEALKAFLVGHNIELEYQALVPGLLGYTDGRRITCGLGQASHIEFATLAHETTHVLLHFPANGGTRPVLTTRETEAEAVTYLLCAQLGIAGTEASVEYIKNYRGTPDTLDASLERIRATAQRLSGELAAITFKEPSAGSGSGALAS